MPIISADVAAQVRRLFGGFTGDVSIDHYTRKPSKLVVPGRPADSPYAEETLKLLTELAELSDKIHLTVHDVANEPDVLQQQGLHGVPATVLSSDHAAGRLRYYGIPAGHEFSTLIQQLVSLSTGDTGLADKTVSDLQNIERDVHIQVFVTPT